METEQVVRRTQAWVRGFVIGLNLCPFAKSVEEGGRVRYAVYGGSDREELYQFYLTELERLVMAELTELETTLVIVPNYLAAFDDYLDFLDIAEECIERADLEGVVQVASFHPQYQFADVGPEDVSNYTNRAPYPVLHLLREDSVTEAVERHPDVDGIPDRNVALMREMGVEGVRRVLSELG